MCSCGCRRSESVNFCWLECHASDVRLPPLQAAPAMNTAMWDHPLTGQQLQTLQGFGWQLIDPIAKQLACGDVGLGAMEEPPAIADAVGRASHEYLTRPSGFNPAGQPQVIRQPQFRRTSIQYPYRCDRSSASRAAACRSSMQNDLGISHSMPSFCRHPYD